MYNSLTLPAKDFKAIIAATFADYRRREITLDSSGVAHISDLNWSGGTRMEYRSCTIEGRPLGSLEHLKNIAPWDQIAEGKSVNIPVGGCLVQGGYFCGKVARLRIHINPQDMPRYLQKPAA